MRIQRPGRYATRDEREAFIVRIAETRAYGYIPGYYDRTWWYAGNGEHALCPIDDLLKHLGDLDGTVS